MAKSTTFTSSISYLLFGLISFEILGSLAVANEGISTKELFESFDLLKYHPQDELKELFLTENVVLTAVPEEVIENGKKMRSLGETPVGGLEGFHIIEISRTFMDELYGTKVNVVCLKKGTPLDYTRDYYESTEKAIASIGFSTWFTEKCGKIEFGLVSFEKDTLEIFWTDHNGNLQSVGDLLPGERNTVWRFGYVGHKFLVKAKNEDSSFLPFHFRVFSDCIFRIGTQKSFVGTKEDPPKSEYTKYHKWEIERASRIKRIFTDTGYKRVPIPRRLWGSIRTFWNNNRNDENLFSEIWGGKGIFVNWWKTEPKMSVVPFVLKKSWHDMFQPVLEEWSNTTLESTDLYGIRVYYRGAELIDHVDRHETHAVSAIINVEQGGMNSDWELEIYDVHGNIIHSDLQRGEAMLYESAKCMHGRPKALDGDFYANVFFHYRPVGDRNWWREPKHQHEEL